MAKTHTRSSCYCVGWTVARAAWGVMTYGANLLSVLVFALNPEWVLWDGIHRSTLGRTLTDEVTLPVMYTVKWTVQVGCMLAGYRAGGSSSWHAFHRLFVRLGAAHLAVVYGGTAAFVLYMKLECVKYHPVMCKGIGLVVPLVHRELIAAFGNLTCMLLAGVCVGCAARCLRGCCRPRPPHRHTS